VVTPLLVLPFPLVLVSTLVQVGRRGLVAASVGVAALGACVLLCFFFWTAAVAGLGLYLAARLVAWRLAAIGGRAEAARVARREFVLGAVVLAGGLALGAPQILGNARMFADPEVKPVLQRLSRGQVLPPGHPLRTLYLRNSWAAAKLAAATVLIAALGAAGAWRLAPVYAVALAALLLTSSAAITGLEFENFHWLMAFHPLIEIVILAGVGLALHRWGRAWSPKVGLVLAAVPAGLLVLALVWRPYEALHAPWSVSLNQTLRSLDPIWPALEELGTDDVLAGPFEANVAVLAGRAGQLYQFNQTSHSSLIPDEEVHLRHALNAWLRGLSRDEYGREAASRPFPGGAVTKPSWRPEAVAARRLELFDRLESDPAEAAAMLDRFDPTALLRPTADGPPRVAAPGRFKLAARPGRSGSAALGKGGLRHEDPRKEARIKNDVSVNQRFPIVKAPPRSKGLEPRWLGSGARPSGGAGLTARPGCPPREPRSASRPGTAIRPRRAAPAGGRRSSRATA
jgi:hypothetical protein